MSDSNTSTTVVFGGLKWPDVEEEIQAKSWDIVISVKRDENGDIEEATARIVDDENTQN